MEGPISHYNLRGPSPVVWAMRTRIAPPPPHSDPTPPAPPAAANSDPIPSPASPPAQPLHVLPPPLPPPEKRRRGRPRKYDRQVPPPPPGFVPSLAVRAPSKPPAPPLAILGQLAGLEPHVLIFEAGENITSGIMMFSQKNERAICVLSAQGAVQEATLLQSSGGISTHEGHFEIIRLNGSILTSSDDRCLGVTLACPDGTVFGGGIAGPLIAAMPVQAIVGSFHNDGYWPSNRPKILHCTCSQDTIGNIGTPTTVEQTGSNQADGLWWL